MTGPKEPYSREFSEEPPPVLGTWPRVYAAVLIYLCLLISGLYVFMRVFS